MRSRSLPLLVLPLLTALLPASVSAATDAPVAGPGQIVTIETLSNRADLISGGDALVAISVPDGADPAGLAIDVDGRDVTDHFATRSDGRFLGLVDGLALGESRLTATLPDGRGAHLDITNHPHAGPVFSGPHIQPWTCSDGAEDEHCNRPPTYELLYMPEGGDGLEEYDPDAPPDDVSETTTDEGETVPFIVRVETGVITRDQYKIAVLFDPEQGWTPTEPQRGWNNKLLLTHGASCNTSYEMGTAPDVTGGEADEALSRGFAVASHALDNAGHNCNLLTQAESLVMTKEHLVDRYGGPIRYTIGTGCSGGSLTQQQVANAYPGVYQGILPACSFADAWSSGMQKGDYALTRRYFENPDRWGAGVVWTPAQMAEVNGHPNPTNPITFTVVIPNSADPSRDCPGIAEEDVYHHETNIEGVRCSMADYMINLFGPRPPEEWGPIEQQLGRGFARRPADNVGIQYGLNALLEGTLLTSQFVDVNEKIGATDIDGEFMDGRYEADETSLGYLYRSGANNTASNMDQVAIIDLRGPDPGAFHDVYRTYAMRERIIREHGHADNHILWRGSVPLFGDTTFTTQGVIAMDEWLANVEADTRSMPLAQKILDDKPQGLTHRCTDGRGTDVPAEYCDAVVESYETPRIAAGMPLSDDVAKCRLVPLDEFDYGEVTFSDDEWARLEATFPDGVCDYSTPGVGFQETIPWLTYAAGEGGEPLGPAPVSEPFGRAAADDASLAAPTDATLPTTGGSASLALAAMAASLLLVALPRRRRASWSVAD